MKKVIFGILFGCVLGALGFWYLTQGRHNPSVQEKQKAAADSVQRAMDKVEGKIDAIGIDSKLEALELGSEDIKNELAADGKVVRRKARDLGEVLPDKTADGNITRSIKAKLAADPELSKWPISLSTNAGVVTMSGKLSSHALIGKAILLALETDGIREVISTLKVDPVR